MLYHLGCFAEEAVLQIAKDLAENNKGARVLVVCSKLIVVTFRGPDCWVSRLQAMHFTMYGLVICLN